MKHYLPQVRFWKIISIILALTGVLFTLIGIFCTEGALAVHWGSDGTPNGFAGKIVLVLIALMGVLSMFSGKSFQKERPGWHIPVGPEMGYALSTGLTGCCAGVNVIVVLYYFRPDERIPAVGAIAIIVLYLMFIMIAFYRDRRYNGRDVKTGEESHR